MPSWHGATRAGLRRVREIGSRSAIHLSRLKGLQGARGDWKKRI